MTRKENDHGKDIRKNEGHSKTQEEKERAQPAPRHHRELPGITEGEVRHRCEDRCNRYDQTGLLQAVVYVSEDTRKRKHPNVCSDQQNGSGIVGEDRYES